MGVFAGAVPAFDRVVGILLLLTFRAVVLLVGHDIYLLRYFVGLKVPFIVRNIII